MFKRIFSLALLFILMTMALLPAQSRVSAQATACGDVYVVQPGDTLREIAARCGTSVQAILNLNPFIDNSNLIYSGWILDLSAPSAQVGIPQTGARPRSNALYVVKAGDTLPYISRRLDISEGDLLAINPGLESEDDLRTGQILRLTNTVSSPAAAVSPNVVEPGQAVTVLAGGFPANTSLVFAGGPLGEIGTVLHQGQTGSEGWLRTNVQLPVNAERGNRWAIVVYLANNPNVQAVTNLLYIVDTSGPEEPILYTVSTNDTMSSIAARFGISIDSILSVNPQIENPRVIRVGQEILIPGVLMRQELGEGRAAIFLGPSSGPPGSQVDVFGTGFPANASMNLLVLPENNQNQLLASLEVQANARGTFFTTLPIPAGAPQNEVLVIMPDTIIEEGAAPPTARFFVAETGIPQTGDPIGQPSITLNPGSGPRGTIFSVSVSGYPANFPIEMGIGASQVNPNITYNYTTAVDGTFYARIQVPQNAPAGSFYTVSIRPRQFTNNIPRLSARFDVTR